MPACPATVTITSAVGSGIEDHSVSVPGRVLLRHRQRRLRYRDARRLRRPHLLIRGRAVVGAGPRRGHLHRVFRAVGEAGNRVARGRTRGDRSLPVAGVVALAARLPLHLVARGVGHRRPVNHQPRVARCDRHSRHLRRVVVFNRHHDAADRDPAVVTVRARRAVGKRDRIVRQVRVVAGLHRHRLRRVPVCRREGQARRGRGHVRARVPGDRYRDIRRRPGIENHRVSVPGRVLLRHRQRCLRDRRRPRRGDDDLRVVGDGGDAAGAGGEGGGLVAERVLKGNVVVARGRVRVGQHDSLALADVGGNREAQYARRRANCGRAGDAERGAGGGDGERVVDGVEEREERDGVAGENQVLGEHELDLIAVGVDRRAHQRGPRQVDGGVVGDRRDARYAGGERGGLVAGCVLKGNVVARGRVRVGQHDGLALADVGGNREGQYARRRANCGRAGDAERGAGGGDGERVVDGVEERDGVAGENQVLGEHELDPIAGGVDRRAHQRGPRQVDGGVVGDRRDARYAGGEGGGLVAGCVLKGNVVVARGRVRVGQHDGLALADVGGNREGQYARRRANCGRAGDAERGAGGGDGERVVDGVEEREERDGVAGENQDLGEHELDLDRRRR